MFISHASKKLDLIFGNNPSELLINVRMYLEEENLKALSLNIFKEYNNFCAVVVGESKSHYLR